MTLLEQQIENKFISEYDGRLLEPRVLSSDSNIYYNANLNNNCRRDFYSLKNEIDSNESGIEVGGGLLASLDRITTQYIDDGAITTTKIKDDAVIRVNIASGAGVGKIADDAITSDILANGAITSSSLGNYVVKNTHFATGSITVNKIKDNTIANNDVASNTITSAKIQNGIVSTFANIATSWGTHSNADITVDSDGRITAIS